MTTRTEAREQNVNKYNTGKPCKRGHKSDRWTASGSCIACEKERKQTPKYKEKFKVYIKEYHKTYYVGEMHEKKKAYLRNYYQEHKKTLDI